MNSGVMVESETDESLDVIQEIRMRTWARQNYLPAQERGGDLHPVAIDEMNRMDSETE